MKVAVFGKPGGGKSTLALTIAKRADLPLHQLDMLQFSEGGARVPADAFLLRHAQLLAQERWVIDGFGTPQSFAQLLEAADVLVYVERPQRVHYWWVIKRFFKSPWRKPLGWPKGSPMLRSTIDSLRFLRRSHRFWTPAFRQGLLARAPAKRVFVVTNSADVKAMMSALGLA